MRLAVIAVIFLAACQTTAIAQRSIVGRWAEKTAGCAKNSGDTIIIEPLALSAAELSCSFKSVRREGATVIWQGNCALGGGPDKPTMVTARETNDRLVISYSTGGASPPLRRCQ